MTTTDPYQPPVAIAPDGLVHVTDLFGDQFVTPPVPPSVKVYSASGVFVREYGLPQDADHWTAGGVAVAADGTSYVTDTVSARIHKFGADGTHLNSFGSQGAAVGQFDTKVTAVEVRDDGHVYVGDDSDRVKVFTPTGQLRGVVRTGSVLAGPPGLALEGPTGKARVTKTTLRLKKRKSLPLRISCTRAAPCTGKVQVMLGRKKVAKSRTYALRAGTKQTIKVRR